MPFSEDMRSRLLKALAFYEEHLECGGFVDPAAMSLLAHEHLDELGVPEHPFRYRCILVDEVQDLGAVELEVIRALAASGPNALLLAGDSAQQVYPKRHSLSAAGIVVEARHRRYIRKNYRNSRQILAAGLRLLESFGELGPSGDDGFSVLKPELSTRDCSLPLAVQCTSEAEEYHLISRYIAQHLEQWPDSPVCIGVCGVREDDELQLKDIGKGFFAAGRPVWTLLEDKQVKPGNVYIASLETLKGFEFSLVVLMRTLVGTIPDGNAPRAEHWRDARRLYVAITRARDEVLFTYRDRPSPFLGGLGDLVRWSTAREQGLALR